MSLPPLPSENLRSLKRQLNLALPAIPKLVLGPGVVLQRAQSRGKASTRARGGTGAEADRPGRGRSSRLRR